MTPASQWQEQIEQVCTQVGSEHVDLLLDQSAWNNCAIPALKILRPEVQWFSLFSGTPEESLLEKAPLLMRLDLAHWQHQAWLEELMNHCATDARLLVVISPLSFDDLSHALQALSQMQWGGQAGLLRYYDPRIFAPLMSSILTSEQREQYLHTASYWGWLDRDAQPQWLPGTCQAHQKRIDVSPFLVLSDQQCELIGCIGDAQMLLDSGDFEYLETSQERRFTSLYSLIVQASQENHFGDLTEYINSKLSPETVALQ